ncbi:MAG: hypothetical protein E7393_05155 [Ruminococcaceae bacterium]|nr:hypothetical protein [Oscillospiraceae bacterium]
MQLYIPILIVVLSNTFYHICAKSTPSYTNPFASLIISYGVGALLSFVLYYITNRDGHFLHEFTKLHWSSFVLGLAIVGLEAGNLFMYKMGWHISIGQIVTSSLLAVILLFIGIFFYHEALTIQRIIGILICMVGLYFINN